VPYSRLKTAFEIREGARPGRHEAHDIGNLTYISAGLNSFKTGIGATPLALRREPETNRRAHYISDDMLGHYEEAALGGMPETGKSTERLKHAYRQMCAVRRKQLETGFREWLEKVEADGRMEVIPEASPTMRLIQPQDEDMIRVLGFPRGVTDALIELCSVPGIGRVRKKESRFCRGYKVPSSGRTGAQLIRVNIPLQAAAPLIELKVTDVRAEVSLKPCPLGVHIVKENSHQRRYHLDPNHAGAAEVLLGIVRTLSMIPAEARKVRGFHAPAVEPAREAELPS
jgi:hypothetical protein